MTCLVTVDDREPMDLLDTFNQKAIHPVERKRLSVGDIHIQIGTNHECIIERKRVDDLLHSVYDGRLAQQIQNMRDWRHTNAAFRHIVLIIEGDYKLIDALPCHDSAGGKTQVQRTLVHMSLQSDLHTIQTSNVQETVDIVSLLACVFEKQDKHNYTPMCLDVTLKRRRSRSKIGFGDLLCCIPGISLKRAEKIRSVFGSMMDLCVAMAESIVDVEHKLATAMKSPKLAKTVLQILGAPDPSQRID